MKFLTAFLFALTLVSVLWMPRAGAAPPAEVPPRTLLGNPGKLLASEDFARPLPPAQGKTGRFASGFIGWRYNADTGYNVDRLAGFWELKSGAFHGSENVAVGHPATASYGVRFRNAIIACEVRMDDAPLAGRKYRTFGLKLTDDHGYVCAVRIHPRAFGLEKSDNDKKGPDEKIELGEIKMPVKVGDWHPLVVEIVGDEMIATLDGHSLAGRHPLLATEKHSVMFLTQNEGSVRRLRIWDAAPNPTWPKLRAKFGQ